MIHDTLLDKKKTEKHYSCVAISLLLFAFAVFAFLKRETHLHVEFPVGVNVGDRVILLTPVMLNDHVVVPEGVSGMITRIDGEKAFLQLLNFDERQNVYADLSQLQALHLGISSIPPRAGDQWPYWSILVQDDWYKERICLGPLFCTNEHACTEGFHAFNRLWLQLGQTPDIAKFTYVSEVPPDDQKAILHDFVYTLINEPGSRLLYVDVDTTHSFLIEQSGEQFRIYQSWTNGFDLQYWTDEKIPVNSMCEPGMEISQNLMDREMRSANLELGITDDKEKIDLAKHQFGCLKSTNSSEILRLFSAIGHGFSVMLWKEMLGKEFLIPFSQSIGSSSTHRWLGKSALSLSHMMLSNNLFTVEINFLHFDHE